MTAQQTRRRSADRWELWSTRGTQLLGGVIGAHEAFLTDLNRSNVLLFAAALIIGPQGLRMLVRGVRDLNGGREP